MTKKEHKDHVQEVIDRVRKAVTADERFLYAFREQHAKEIEESLRSVDATGDVTFVQEELEHWTREARKQYESPEEIAAPAIVVDDAVAWKRQETLADYLKEFAAEDFQIQRFRRNVLQGGLLSGEEALEFLSSPFTADRRYRAFYAHGKRSLLKPLRVEEGQEPEQLPHRRVIVQGKRKPLSHAVWPLMLTASRGFLFPGDVVTLRDLQTKRPNFVIKDELFRYFPHPHDEGVYIVAKSGSVLAELFTLSFEQLAGYPIAPNKVLWFILTGEFIPSAPVDTRYEKFGHGEFKRTKITLEVEAWMPAEEIVKYYRYAQKELLGRVPRSLGNRDLDLIDFVHGNRHLSRKEQFELWNDKQPPKRQFRQQGHLTTAYSRALKRLTGFDA